MRRRSSVLAGIVAAAALLLIGPSFANAATPPIRHVFVIVLENQSASSTFGPNSPAPYLSKTLTAQGAYLPHYYGIGHASADNYIAMISGQAPNLLTQLDCFFYGDLTPGTIGADGQAEGTGCIYPAGVPTIAGQLLDSGMTWRDYDEGMGADPIREPSVCAHPGVDSLDDTQSATSIDQYATRHNPFVYFHSIIDDTTLCDTHVVTLDYLTRDLATAANTPNYAFITPDLCDDAHDATCADGGPGGLAAADAFLREWVPQITSSPAFRTENGLLIITFDEAATSDTSSCCGEIPGPGSPLPGLFGPGGGDTGAVLLSPCIAPGTVSEQPYNHYTMLRSVEDIFGLPHLGYAALPNELSFGADVFTRACAPPTVTLGVQAPASSAAGTGGPRVIVSWRARGAQVAAYRVEVRTVPGRWRALRVSVRHSRLVFTGREGRRYQFRIRATDVFGASGAWATTRTWSSPR